MARADLPRFAKMASGVTRLIQNHPGPIDAASLTAILEAGLDRGSDPARPHSEQSW
ncbi:hypothetical protein ACFFMR_31435 [Micromonospora andamanensis]|uniref:FXSXX-COOH protein n=1 Tax=Micromonospora andamanensis TaxID=1287068 RepID=A0ABQ4I5U7_9ACTN|nr:hypothetical protein [Micromonospora andamanensis]GIJ13259.1 hypothetical protein Van01_64730 [Micromonospora andamanensis]